jgi:outer membrane protein TolC
MIKMIQTPTLEKVTLALRSCGIAIRLVLCVVFLWPGSLLSQSFEQDDTAPLLTLEEAVQMALSGNRSLGIVTLEVENAHEQVSLTKIQRLPGWNSYALGSQLLNSLDWTFPKGAFGTFPGIGPVPASNTSIVTPARSSGLVVEQVTQPLSQLYKIHLSLRAQELALGITDEKLRAERQSVVDSVKQTYCAVLQSESSLEAAESMLEQYQELDRVLLERVSQEAALKSDSLEVKAKLAQERYALVQLRDALQSRKEYLNDLLGRDIRTEFRTEGVPALSPVEMDLAAAQSRALSQRPEIREAELTERQAGYGRRLAKADYIPDVSVAFNYISPLNVNVVPTNITALGLEFKWQPFDWGRRKHEIQQKQIALEQTRAQLLDTRSKVLLDVNNRFRKLQESRTLLEAAQAEQDWSREKLRDHTRQFEQRTVLLSDVLQQQAMVSKSNDDYAQALLSFWTAKADFEKSLGED